METALETRSREEIRFFILHQLKGCLPYFFLAIQYNFDNYHYLSRLLTLSYSICQIFTFLDVAKVHFFGVASTRCPLDRRPRQEVELNESHNPFYYSQSDFGAGIAENRCCILFHCHSHFAARTLYAFPSTRVLKSYISMPTHAKTYML